MSESIVLTAPAQVDLRPAPIAAEWILADAPEAQCEVISRSRDGAAFSVVWECSPGVFNWHYREDETVVLLAGEVFITDDSGIERRLGPGDTGFFPAGSSCRWRVTERVKKVAVLRKSLPLPLGLSLRAWNRFLRLLEPRRESMI